MRAVVRYGPDAGMDEIAAEAGVTKPVLYRHFTDKADLYVAVGARATELLMAKIVPAVAEDGPIFERIRRAVGCYVTFVDDYRELYRFLVLRPNPHSKDLVQEDKSKIAGVLTELLAGYLNFFQLDATIAGPTAHGIVGLVQGAVLRPSAPGPAGQGLPERASEQYFAAAARALVTPEVLGPP